MYMYIKLKTTSTANLIIIVVYIAHNFFTTVRKVVHLITLDRDTGSSEAKKSKMDGQKYTPNPYIDTMESDFMYHIGYSKQDCLEKFGDVKVPSNRWSYDCRSVDCPTIV